jgi:hypothetical protein
MSRPILPFQVFKEREVSDDDLKMRMEEAVGQPEMECKGLMRYPSYAGIHDMEKEMEEQGMEFYKFDRSPEVEGVYLFRKDTKLYTITVKENGEVKEWLHVGSSRYVVEGK